MVRYILRRLLLMAITLFLILTVTFFILKMLPGSPFNNPKLTFEQRQSLNDAYGLNDPAYMQYYRYMKGVLTEFNFGTSFKLQNQPVADLILAKIPVTARIGLLALIFGAVFGISLGAFAAINRNGFWDHASTILAVIGVSIPGFVFAAILQYFFAYKWDLFPFLYTRATAENGMSFAQELYTMILPSFSLAIYVISSTMRFMRTELVEVLNSDYILLARAKGLSRSEVIVKHALRNALIPVITILGPMTVMLISGSTVIETFFGVPGLAKMMINAVNTRDYFLILGISFSYSAMFVFVVLVVDILYVFIDPRIRLVGGKK